MSSATMARHQLAQALQQNEYLKARVHELELEKAKLEASERLPNPSDMCLGRFCYSPSSGFDVHSVAHICVQVNRHFAMTPHTNWGKSLCRYAFKILASAHPEFMPTGIATQTLCTLKVTPVTYDPNIHGLMKFYSFNAY